jgi:hypothetical protein
MTETRFFSCVCKVSVVDIRRPSSLKGLPDKPSSICLYGGYAN